MVFQEKLKRFISKRIWFFLSLAVLLFFAVSLLNESINRRVVDRQIIDYQNNIGKLKIENYQLQEKIDNWSKSGELELTARAKLNLEKPGEKTVMIIRPETPEDVVFKNNQEAISLATKNSVVYEPNFLKWWQYFFNQKD